jgi:hypothetical protein
MEKGVKDYRTRYPKRTQRILWAAGEAALFKAIQPRHLVRAVGDGVSLPEANTKGSIEVRFWKDCRDQSGWPPGREMPRIWEAPWSLSEG